MDLDTALHTALVDDDIKKHCHVNSNEDGDRFVGIKADSDNAMVYFPIGYQLPETDNEIRTDIKHLIQVLSEFTTSEDRLIAVNKFAAPQSVDFPINAYKSVIEYYFSIGGKYYIAAVKVPRSGVYTGIVEQHKEKLAAEGAKIARDYQIIILNCAPRIEQVAF